MDENQFEMAERLEEAQRECAIRAAGLRAGRESHPGFDGLHCVGPTCGEPILQARLDMGKVRCVPCQQLLEKRNAHTRK